MSSLFNFYSDPIEGRFRSIVNYKIDISSQTFYEESPDDIVDMTTGSLWVDTSSSDQNIFRYIHNYTGTFLGYKYESSTWSAYSEWTVSSKPVWVDVDDQKITQFKTYITVSTDSTTGQYTDIQDAIDALPSEGGIIFIKNGTYVITDDIQIPAKDITIIGENRDRVIIDANGEDYGFYFLTSGTGDIYDGIFKVESLTIKNIVDDGDFGESGIIFRFDNFGNSTSSTSGGGGGEIIIDSITVEDCENTLLVAIGDIERITINNCIFTNSVDGVGTLLLIWTSSLYQYSLDTVYVNLTSNNSNCSRLLDAGDPTDVSILGNGIISNNICNAITRGIRGKVNPGHRMIVNENNFTFLQNYQYDRYAIYLHGSSSISGNVIKSTDTEESATITAIDLNLQYSTVFVKNNIINLIVSDDPSGGDELYGINLSVATTGHIVDNDIKITNNDPGRNAYSYGIILTNVDNSRIANNRIQMDNFTDREVGFVVGTSVNNNKIFGNMTVDVYYSGTLDFDGSNDVSENTDI